MALKGLRTTLVDVSDLSYQASPAFKPDKTALWKGPMEEDGWVQSHNAIRGELATMRTVLAGLKQPIQPWEVECIKTWWAGHKVHVHDLHATILHALGIDHENLTYFHNGRDERLTDVGGRVVTEIFA